MWNLFHEQMQNPDIPIGVDFPGCPSTPESLTSDYNEDMAPNWVEEDIMENVKYDQMEWEKHPELFKLISPVNFKPLPSPSVPASPEDLESDPELPSEDGNFADVSSSIFSQFFPICLDDFSDDFINDIAKVDINSTIFDDPLGYSSNSDDDDKDSSPDDIPARTYSHGASHLDYDHCYSAPPKVEEKAKKLKYLDFSQYSPYSTGSSSEEVDVVTVTEEPTPIVPKKGSVSRRVTQRAPPKTAPSRAKSRKGVNKKTIAPPPPPPSSARALKAAVRNNRITGVRRANVKKSKRNSLETPSPSLSSHSSRHSSQCNSDAEESGKRANHNISERNRRIMLKDMLQDLRRLVPSTVHNIKASKVTILNAANKHVCELKDKETGLLKLKKVEEQRRKQREAHLKVLLAQVKKQIC